MFHININVCVCVCVCVCVYTRMYPKFQDWIDNEINNNSNEHSLRSNTKGYGGKTH
jgi:hypothetical protein